MEKINEVVEKVLRRMPKDELDMLVFYAEERGLDGIVERGGSVFRELAEEESLELDVTLIQFIKTANEVGNVVANVGNDILEELEGPAC